MVDFEAHEVASGRRLENGATPALSKTDRGGNQITKTNITTQGKIPVLSK